MSVRLKVVRGDVYNGGPCTSNYRAFNTKASADRLAATIKSREEWEREMYIPGQHDRIIETWWLVVEATEPEFNECGEVCY